MTAITPSETRAVAAPGRLRGYHSGAREIDEASVEVRGELPGWLRGGLLLNGPALWDLPEGGYKHWFDGLAMMHRVSIDANGVRYRSRFQQTADYRASVAARKPALPGFATPDPLGFFGRIGKERITDNTAVAMARIGGQWVAQTETPFVTAFDPVTLETQGHVNFTDKEKLHLMSAHGINDADGNYWNVGVELGPKCTYKVFRVRPGSLQREVVGRWTVPKSGYLHALALTPTHVLVWETALRAQPLKFIFTGNSYIDNFTWTPEAGSRIVAVSRADGSIRSWDVPPMVAFHAVQAYDDGTDIVLELCNTEPSIFGMLTLERLRGGKPLDVVASIARYRLQAGKGSAEPEVFVPDVDLPMVHGAYWTNKRARYAWLAGADPQRRNPSLDRTVKVDLDAKQVCGTYQRPNAAQLEPLFVDWPGSTEEEDGVLLVPTLADDDTGSVVAVVDPASMQARATLHLPQVVPFGFHAAWDAA
ncbi:carotenoid oxygenase family protein [Ramlibacter albus]|uniref:Carotenoid oxygenase family protein n=1 Tax=Ramlibacter albus TaxID=2079448 RepID=A0A923S1E3_9BURK|nr:carotenoid oxygenase family protein [Ramlibacter albus]MBC5764195.1 carotenoid oxygenase family protein [Ramlibacter albus]